MNDVIPQESTQQPAAPAAPVEDAQAAFSAGFANARGEPTAQPQAPADRKPEAKEEAPPAKPAEEAAPAAAPAAEEDPWKDVPKKMRETLEAVQNSVASLTNHVKPLEGRLGKMQRVFDEWKAAKDTPAPAAAPAPTQEQMDAATKSTAKWDELKDQYPQWAEAMEERLAAERAAAKPAAPAVDPEEIRAKIRSELEQSVQQQILEATRAAHSTVVELRHPGWVATVKSEDFKAWRAKQTAEVNALGASENATDAIKLLDLYKEAKQKEKAAASRLKSAELPSGVPAIPTATSDQDAFSAGYKKARGG